MRLIRPTPPDDWEPFWGCSRFPGCKARLEIDADGFPDYPDGELPVGFWEDD
jgi:hypothetical protein